MLKLRSCALIYLNYIFENENNSLVENLAQYSKNIKFEIKTVFAARNQIFYLHHL